MKGELGLARNSRAGQRIFRAFSLGLCFSFFFFCSTQQQEREKGNSLLLRPLPLHTLRQQPIRLGISLPPLVAVSLTLSNFSCFLFFFSRFFSSQPISFFSSLVPHTSFFHKHVEWSQSPESADAAHRAFFLFFPPSFFLFSLLTCLFFFSLCRT